MNIYLQPEQVLQELPEQLFEEFEFEENSSLFEELLNPTGENTLTIFLLPHLSHFISLPSLLIITISQMPPQSLHL